MYQFKLHLKLQVIFLLLITTLKAQDQGPSNCGASPYPIKVKQQGGSTITIVGKGTLRNSWTETLDGYTVVKNKKGIYEYALKKGEQLVPSGIVAKDVNARKQRDNDLLKKIPKSLTPSIKNKGPYFTGAGSTSGPQMVGYQPKGTLKALLILIKYPDMSNEYASTNFFNLMNQAGYNGTGSFKDFFTEASFGQLNITTDVFGWYTAKNNYNYYGSVNGSTRTVDLVREAVDAANNQGVDFSKYDNDGDGVVDGVIVVHAGPGAEEGNQNQYIWSHRWVLAAAGKQVNYDGVLINDYIINPEKRTFTKSITGIGVFCHEFGHNMGLPDLYDTDDTNGDSEGIGEWGLMGSAGWLGNENSPGNMEAWCKEQMGWIKPTVLTAAGNYTINPASTHSECYRINTPVASEYFLVENRQKTGLDVALKGTGLAIFHINTNKTNLNDNRVNGDEALKGVSLEEADGVSDLNDGNNRGDTGDLFPGRTNNTVFNNTSSPSSKTYNGNNTNISISGISVNNGVISFNFGSAVTPAPTVTNFSPTSGDAGTLVTITGTNFTGTTSVKFNGTAATFTIVSSTSITANVPTGASTGAISVANGSGQATSATSFTVNLGGAPANDNCVGAITLNIGTECIATAGSTAGATKSFEANQCGNYTGDSDDDVWYKFVATATSHQISVAPSTGFDAVIEFFSGDCNGLTFINCADEGYVGVGETIIPSDLIVGQTYYFRVFDYETGSGSGTFDVCVTGAVASAVPTITSFTPESANEGAYVEITGTNLTGATSIKFNGVAANNFTVNSSTSITTLVPGGATTGKISVTTPNGVAESLTDFVVNVPTVTITDFSPSEGDAGTVVTITGTDFTGATAVRFNGVDATTFNIGSANSITATVPDGATYGKVSVVAPNGTAVSKTDFIILSALPSIVDFSPSAGTEGTIVTITGINFNGATAVKFNGVQTQEITVYSNTSIVAVVPTGATSGVISIETPNGNTVSINNFIVNTAVGMTNDDCAGAITLLPSPTYSAYSANSAGATLTLPANTCAGYEGIADDDVWFKFVATATDHTIKVVPSTGYDPVIEIYSSDCGNLEYAFCEDSWSSGSVEEMAGQGFTIGATYLFRVFNWEQGAGSGTFDVGVIGPEPTADDNGARGDELVVYPNPAAQNLIVQIPSGMNQNKMTLNVYNNLGVKMQLRVAKKDESAYDLSISNYPSGQYILNLQDGTRFYKKVFIKQ